MLRKCKPTYNIKEADCTTQSSPKPPQTPEIRSKGVQRVASLQIVVVLSINPGHGHPLGGAAQAHQRRFQLRQCVVDVVVHDRLVEVVAVGSAELFGFAD